LSGGVCIEMTHPKPKPKKQRATAATDLWRLVICAMGCGLLSISISGYVDDEADLPLAVMLAGVAAGLGLIGLGIFGKPNSIEGF
jgi:hypothetical protein